VNCSLDIHFLDVLKWRGAGRLICRMENRPFFWTAILLIAILSASRVCADSVSSSEDALPNAAIEVKQKEANASASLEPDSAAESSQPVAESGDNEATLSEPSTTPRERSVHTVQDWFVAELTKIMERSRQGSSNSKLEEELKLLKEQFTKSDGNETRSMESDDLKETPLPLGRPKIGVAETFDVRDVPNVATTSTPSQTGLPSPEPANMPKGAINAQISKEDKASERAVSDEVDDMANDDLIYEDDFDDAAAPLQQTYEAERTIFIHDLVRVLAAAAAGGFIAALFKQPPMIGYLIGGMIIGPSCFGLIKAYVQVDSLAQFGVAFLLFALGVEFSLSEIRKVQQVAIGGGILQILLTIALTTFLTELGGLTTTRAEGILVGSTLSLSSTAVVLKCLMERHEIQTPHGQVMLGILVVQDLAVGFMLAILPALNKERSEILWSVARELYYLVLFAAGATLLGYWVIPYLLRTLSRFESPEVFLLGIVVLCLGVALVTEALGLSIEMGAFVAGLMIAETPDSAKTLQMVTPLRDIFSSMFFVCIGMLIDPKFLWNNLSLLLLFVLIVFIGKVLIITPLVRMFHYTPRTALVVGVGLAQVGEFSFVLASKGQRMGLISRNEYLLLAGTTALTLILTPFAFKFAHMVGRDSSFAQTTPRTHLLPIRIESDKKA